MAAAQRVERVEVVAQFALDMADDVLHVAVAFDDHLFRQLHAARLAHAADVVAAEVDEHGVLGQLFRIGEQLLGQTLIFFRSLAAQGGSGDRAHRDAAVLDAHQQLGAGADQAGVA